MTESLRNCQSCNLSEALFQAKIHLGDWTDQPQFADLVTPYQKWLTRHWSTYWPQWPETTVPKSWVTQFWKEADGMAERSQQNLLYDYITEKLGSYVKTLPTESQAQLTEILKSSSSSVAQRAERAFEKLAYHYSERQLRNPPSLIPPLHIVELLRAVVKVFG